MQPSRSKTRIERREFTTLSITICYWWMLLLLVICPGVSSFGGRPIGVGDVTEMPNFLRHSHEARQVVDFFSVRAGTYGQTRECQSLVRPSSPPLHSSRKEAKYRRLLIGPGSSPPTCQAKCGVCTPCKPVRISTGGPHSAAATTAAGVISGTEYYPEVWRCQCGDKLYMP